MPALQVADFQTLALHFHPDGPPLRAASDQGVPGHPVLFPRRFLADLQALRGDTGARDLLARARPVLVPRPGRRALTDLDTPEAWAAWRAAGKDGL